MFDNPTHPRKCQFNSSSTWFHSTWYRQSGCLYTGGVKLHILYNSIIFKRVTANPANCWGLLRGSILHKAHSRLRDLQWLL
jgi:hypothetical protein